MASAGDKPSSGAKEVECASCRSLGRSEKAVKYCINCMECMCQQCLNICHTPKPMRHHKFSDIGSQLDKSTDDLDLLQKMSTLVACPSHPNETIKFHCLDHDTFCCTHCIVVDHRKCIKVIDTEKQVIGGEVKGEMLKIKGSVSSALEEANDILEQMQLRAQSYDKQTLTIAETLNEIRGRINKLLDDLESKCNKTAKTLCINETLKIEHTMDRLKTEIAALETHASLVTKIDECGSASHQYIARITSKEKLKDFEIMLEETASNFQSSNVSLKQEKLLKMFFSLDENDIVKLGSVVKSPDKPLSSQFNTNGRLERCTFNKTAEKKVKANYSCSNHQNYSSIVCLPNNQLVLLDSCNDSGNLLLVSEDGKVLSSCDFVSYGATSNSKPYCITVTKPEGLIALSLPEQKKICSVSTTDGQLNITDKVIQTKHKPGAIFGLKNGNLAVAWRDPAAFGIIEIHAASADKEDKVYFCKDKAGRSLESFEYMAIDEERSHVIQPCKTDRAVYCIDFNGNPKFKYTNPELDYPRGVAVDRDGNIYVCDYLPSCIHVISPTGSASRLIKDEWRPLAIAFNKDGDRFAITRRMNDSLITFFRVQIENS